MTRLGLLICLLACPVVSPCARVTLARDGKPAATIVTPTVPDAMATSAARELQHYVTAVCGVELPIREGGKRVAGAGLYIGRCEITTAADLPAADLNPETYAIHTRDGNVLFTGRWPTPTYFAVASFLEGSLGVRWFAPGELWEYVPRGTPGELTVAVTDTVSVPETSPRIWSGHAWFDDWKAWGLRNKAVLGEVVPRRQFQNFLNRVFPPEKYAHDHPEYYPLIGGKRWIPPPGSDSNWRPCESNPEVLRLTVEYARRWFDEHPTIDSFSLGMDDISHLCSCAGCRAMDAHPDSYEKGQFSDRHYKFVNAVAREVAKTHPDRYIGTLIYAIARELPETVARLEDNVFGFITETSAAWWMPGRQEADQALTREWAKRCKHLSRYDYYGFASMTPRFYPHHMDEQIKFDKSLGMEGMYAEVYTFLPHTAPMMWALARLQWDSRPPVDELLNEFYAKMYGPAAGVMKQYFDLLERSYNTPRPGRGAWEHRNLRNQALAISAEDMETAFALLDSARETAADNAIRARIEIHQAALQYASYAVYPSAISERAAALRIEDQRSAEQAVAMAGKLAQLTAGREACWAAAAQRNDLLGETVRGLGRMGYLQTGTVPDIERGALVGAMKAMEWYSRNAPDKVAAASAQLAGSGNSPFGEAVRAWVWVMQKQPPNLVVNGDFEDRGTNTGTAEQDWTTAGAPRGWSTWSANAPTTRFAVLGGKGHTGSAAATISGGVSSCYLQSCAVTAGRKYLCVCWAAGVPSGKASGAKLGIRYRDPAGAWHKRQDLEPTIHLGGADGAWQPLAMMVTVPEGAAGLLVMPGAAAQDAGAMALFDDVALYDVTELK